MDWQKYAPKTTTRTREAIEWSINYAYNATDTTSPRVLLVGDSICNAYQGDVRRLLDGRVNVSFWASSRCVTDKDYFCELNHFIEQAPYALVCFNNGLHSFSTDRAEWQSAYSAAVDFITDSLPETKVALTLCTPLRVEELTKKSAEMNEFVKKLAKERGLDTIDLFSPMAGLSRAEYWRDDYHFTAEAVNMQAEIIAGYVLEAVETVEGAAAHAATLTGPDGKVE